MASRYFTVAFAALIAAGVASGASAKVRTKTFDYKQASTTLEGYVAWDDAATGKRPAVLIFPTYTGASDFEQEVARKLAARGFVAMVAGVYEKGVHPAAGKDAGTEMAKYMGDRTLLRARVQAGLDRLLEEKTVDAKKVATIGYCFGGAGSLELGRQGAAVQAIVSLHGTLASPNLDDASNIKGKVLVLHGQDDPVTPPKEIDEFRTSMDKAGVDMTFVMYSQTRHSFTMPSAGTDNTKASAYNERSAKRAWSEMTAFLDDTLKH